ncbi:MAG: anthranilate synthase component I family protein [Balneolaceae bacterium]|nr:anthranilate synthase component I family protein [Balneolaceae bacterium]MCH8548212.1 anthranilate synthase component I family protein [Balneolaceae bacterium]
MNHPTIKKLVKALRSARKDSSLICLESQLKEHPSSVKSYVAGLPAASISARGNTIRINEEGSCSEYEGNPWSELKNFRHKHSDWLFGYLGYDLKNHSEKLSSNNRDLTGMPDLFFMVPGFLAEIEEDRIHLIRGDESFLKKALSHSTEESGVEFSLEEFGPIETEVDYCRKIEKIQEMIREGEFYEMNYAHPMRGTFYGDGFDLFESMRGVNPVPFAAYLELDDVEVICSSPERFLRKRGNHLLSEPIKGTSARSDDPNEDRKRREELFSEKNRAENLMIVDLVRHDLSAVSKTGSVKVEKLYEVQSFGTVHQLISSVTAEAAPDADPIDIIRACFPMGSMTGAPKIRVMEVIEELEIFRRGIYSGAIGYITPDADFDLNVVIRTAILNGKELVYPAGGAITGDSDPKSEWSETEIKARAITKVFEESSAGFEMK